MKDDDEEIDKLLQNLIDKAKLAGLPNKQLQELTHLVTIEYRHLWRLDLKPGDRISVPPLKIKMKADAPPPPRPYQRRYTKEETDFLRETLKKLQAAGIIRKSKSRRLLPINIIKKPKGGHRLVIDARHSNKYTIADLYLIPRLDDINCHLALSTCYAAFDAPSGY